MSTAVPLVVHLLAADVSAGKLAVLHSLCSHGQAVVRQRLVHFGPGVRYADQLPQPIHVRAPLGLSRLGASVLRRVVDELSSAAPESRCILHVWSPEAVAGARTLVSKRRPLLVEVEAGGHLHRVARALTTAAIAGPVDYACPTALARGRLLELGVAARRCLLIGESVDLAELARSDRAGLRQRLGLEPQHTAVVALPPVSRAAGTLFATWAALLLEKTRPDVRLIVPAAGCADGPLRRLVRACRHDYMVRFAGPWASPAELAALADLAVYLPLADAPVSGLLWAMAAGCPIIATSVPAVRELLVDGHNAWLCAPGDPRAAAGRMLTALECPEESRRMAQAARDEAGRFCDRQLMRARYQRVYLDLAAGRSSSEGLPEPGLEARTDLRF